MLKDAVFPERILSVVCTVQFLKRCDAVLKVFDSVCTRLLEAGELCSVKWDKAHVGSITKNDRTVAKREGRAGYMQHGFMVVKSSLFVPSLGAGNINGAPGLAA